ncbi:hypothetical protein CN271_21460 [Bacillus cereus]|nr:DUF4029 domain-containing protein [Bacillus cereus]PEE40189.1 hypothetical protein CON59_00980 [Bacillus cereus]PET53147.1 hypothetical protein CN523_01090 [Bacillus cereus]PEV85520.1 hypothetical protein CN429_06350 [Bacillus cereus]PFA60385.1 hypothetical protein CN389_02135 [Bacillus cereus]PFD67261.1 hypothetical protein CN271_21460 [Bacillus cereus]
MLRRKLLYLFLTVPLYAWLISMTKIELMALFLGYVFIFSNLNRIQEQSILEICLFSISIELFSIVSIVLLNELFLRIHSFTLMKFWNIILQAICTYIVFVVLKEIVGKQTVFQDNRKWERMKRSRLVPFLNLL